MKRKIGVIGSSEVGEKAEEKAATVGREVAKSGCLLLTGGCTGIPHAAVEGAREEGGVTVGISPALNEKEHLEKYGYPVTKYDLMIYTGFGLKGRNVILVRSCDGVIAISGGIGTLNELTIAHAEGKTVGLLKRVPGASSEFEKLVEKLGVSERRIITSEDPGELVQEVLENL